jgi:N-acetyltransferase
MSIPAEAIWPPAPNISLVGGTVSLAIATPNDADELFTALDDDRVWQHVAGRPSSPQELASTITSASGLGRHMYVVRLSRPHGGLAAEAVVGTTSLFDGSSADARCEIGFTLYRHDMWGTHVNPDAKVLLLGFCFQGLKMNRVQLKTDVRNERSQRAIAGLGAVKEGVLRDFQRRSDGSMRDTVLFSILASEWPSVRSTLRQRLGQA